jgi:hypothetical protein
MVQGLTSAFIIPCQISRVGCIDGTHGTSGDDLHNVFRAELIPAPSLSLFLGSSQAYGTGHYQLSEAAVSRCGNLHTPVSSHRLAINAFCALGLFIIAREEAEIYYYPAFAELRNRRPGIDGLWTTAMSDDHMAGNVSKTLGSLSFQPCT